ncbi:MAG: PP2C family protein-serine/threonine phosphatase, partial [Acidimicrobiales bacterium]
LVRTLQQVLVPPAPPDIPGLELEAVYRPAGNGAEVGGDFYDVFELGPDDWVITVGDVRGKGIGAAVLTALARHTVRGAAVRLPCPSDILSALNDVLLRDASDRFCTVVAVRVQRASGGWKATICCGGHPLPLLQRRGLPPALVGRPGSLLGVFAGPTLHDVEVELRPGDELLLYTDGVTEGRREDGTFFGDERFARSVAAHSGGARRLVDGTLEDVLAFQAGNPRDDTVVVALRVPES